ncbi:MAG: phage tail protein I [Deltaproteobacteria bacterium]|nr:phage tail protein I [Deltaproteobacteria bacterium]
MVAEAYSRKVVRVPDLVGHPMTKARLMVEDAGLAVDAILFSESYETHNQVVDQEPKQGKMIYEGSKVTLYVARRGATELLPAIYRRSDALGANLVRDLCFILEHMFGSVTDVLDVRHSFYDPHECPADFLPWLASWTALVIDMDWPEDKQRAIVKRAVDLYRIRGTRRGLSLFLKLFTGLEPIIDENEWPFRGFRIGVNARLGLDSVVLPPVELAHTFVVTMPVRFTEVTADQVVRIHQIVQMEKPAHTHYYLRFLEEEGDAELREFFAIGLRSGIGIGDEVVKESEGEEEAPGEGDES